MLPHERAMVDRLKNEPFALIGINSDGDGDVSSKLDDKEKAAIRALGGSTAAGIDRIRSGDAATLAKLKEAAAGLRKKILDADLANLRKILDQNKISWRQAVDGSTSGPIATRWNVQGWPTIYVLDEKGVIRFKGLRDAELEEAVVGLLGAMKEDGKR
jgi:hypothetical protein